MSEMQWFVAVQGKQEGPYPENEVVARIRSGRIGRDAHVFAAGFGRREEGSVLGGLGHLLDGDR